jgi:hypothetical protein
MFETSSWCSSTGRTPRPRAGREPAASRALAEIAAGVLSPLRIPRAPAAAESARARACARGLAGQAGERMRDRDGGRRFCGIGAASAAGAATSTWIASLPPRPSAAQCGAAAPADRLFCDRIAPTTVLRRREHGGTGSCMASVQRGRSEGRRLRAALLRAPATPARSAARGERFLASASGGHAAPDAVDRRAGEDDRPQRFSALLPCARGRDRATRLARIGSCRVTRGRVAQAMTDAGATTCSVPIHAPLAWNCHGRSSCSCRTLAATSLGHSLERATSWCGRSDAEHVRERFDVRA